MRWRRLLLAVCCWYALDSQAQDVYTFKFATLAPSGSTWMNIIEDWARQVEKDSHGRLVFKLYPGGVAGDETDVLQKIHFGQYQGGAFTGYGIGHVYAPARVLEIPFLFRNYAEIDYVRQRSMSGIEAGFHENGYELLGWMEMGFVRFFSRKPIRNLEDLRKQRIWLWQGDPLGQAFFEATNISPVPLSITDVYTSLSTGMIDTVYATPLSAIAMQWFNKTKYVTNVPMANGIGALLVSRKFFDPLPADLKALLKSTGQAAGVRLVAETRRDNEKSLAVLRQNGLQFLMTDKDVDPAEFAKIRDQAALELARTGYIPQPVFDRVRKLLGDYRASKPGV